MAAPLWRQHRQGGSDDSDHAEAVRFEQVADLSDPRLVRSELLRHGPSHQSRPAGAAATRERPYRRRLQRPWDCVDAAHRLLLRYEMGDRSASRKPAREVKDFGIKVT